MNKRILYFGRSAHLCVKHEQLKVRIDDSEEERIFAPSEIAYVEFDSPKVSITTAALNSMMQNDVVFLICNEKHLPVGMCLPLVGHTLQQKHQRAQLAASVPTNKNLWMQTVRAKINNQASVLEILEQPSQRLRQLARKVRSGDPDNLEGQAASYYWPRVFGNPDFRREPTGPTPNDMLNYGYAVLRALVARSLVMAGLMIYSGIHHSNQYNPFPLADDIMEPFRPLVDLWVVKWLEENPPSIVLHREIKAHMLQLPTLSLHHQGRHPDLLTTAATVSQNLARCYLNDVKTLDYPEICPSILTV